MTDILDKTTTVNIQLLPHAVGTPAYASEDSAGMDLQAAIEEDVTILPNARLLVPTGVIIALPQGHEGQIRPRSGLAYKHGLTVLNSPGTIDADYRGEVKVLLVNLGSEAFTITPGMRIAQMVVAQYTKLSFNSVADIEVDTNRGVGGFGSTGI